LRNLDEISGGSPYGASTIAVGERSRVPSGKEGFWPGHEEDVQPVFNKME